MKGAFDLFGEALLEYSKGDKSKFYFEDINGNRYEEDIGKFFRKNRPYYPNERKIVSLVKGHILDVGCGIGGFIPGLMKKGYVLGIDNSKIMIRLAKKRGFKNVQLADIFNFKTNKRFDTICLLDENLGIAETVSNTKKLLRKLSKLLKDDGQILANVENVKDNYSIWKARCIWKDKKGKYFRWIKFNSDYLNKLCKEQKLNFEIISKDGPRYVAKITKQ